MNALRIACGPLVIVEVHASGRRSFQVLLGIVLFSCMCTEHKASFQLVSFDKMNL